jgi:hypothetical protein
MGMRDDMISPISRPLIKDLGFFAGLRFLLGILESDMVIIIARSRIVRLLLKEGVSMPLGKIPVKLVIMDITKAAPIMNALLTNNFSADPIHGASARPI